MGLYVAGLWRYPVKTLAGEPLSTAAVGFPGVPGDRAVWVIGPEGVRTSRRHYRLLGLRGTLNPQGQVLINGHRWESPEALALVKRAAGATKFKGKQQTACGRHDGHRDSNCAMWTGWALHTPPAGQRKVTLE